MGEVALLVITRAIAAFVDRLAEEPRGPQLLVQWDHWCKSGSLVEQVQQGFREVIRLHWAPWDIHDRQSAGGTKALAEIIGETHAASGITRHRMDAAVSGTGSDRNHAPGFRRQSVDPLGRGNWLHGIG